MTKIILIGLDGASWILLDRFLKENTMPTLKNLVEKGVKAKLISPPPYSSNTSWATLFTGVNAGKHGVPHHIVGGKKESPSIWQIISDNDLKSVVVGDPTSFPPDKINGISLSGGFAVPPDSKNYAFPIEIINEINFDSKFQPCLKENTIKKIENGNKKDFLSDLITYTNSTTKVALNLARTHEWSLFVTVIESTDWLHHFLWKDEQLLKKFYENLDRVLKEFSELATTTKANFIIVSDHGFNSIEKHFLVNSWLREANLASFGKPGELRKFLSKIQINRTFLRKTLSKLHLRNFVSKITTSELKKIIPLEEDEHGYIQDSSEAFSEAYNEITINVKDPIRYEKLRNEIIDKLLQLSDNGKKVILEAYKREEIFSGPYVKRASDIQFLPNVGYCWSPSIKDKYIIKSDEFESYRTGDHRPEGIFLAVGPDMVEGKNLVNPIKMCDVVPTMLHILDQQIPNYVDGKVIKEIYHLNSTLQKKQISIKNESEKDFIKRRISQIHDSLKL